MNIQTKQRIIGAVIGAVFLAIAIPFLLSGTKHKQQQDKEVVMQTTPLSLPDTTQTKSTNAQELPLPATDNSPAAKSAPATTNSGSTKITTTTNDSVNEEALPLPKPTITNNSSPVTSQIDSNTNNHQPVVGSNTQEQNPALHAALTQQENKAINSAVAVTTKKATKKTAHKKTAIKTTGASTATNAVAWEIDAGAYQEKAKAQQLLQKLKKDNYHATLQMTKNKGKTLYHVTVGPAMKKDKVTALAQRIDKAFGIKTKIVAIHEIAKTKTAEEQKEPTKTKKKIVIKHHKHQVIAVH